MIAFLYALAIAVLTAYGANLLWLAVTHARQERLLEGPVPTDPGAPPARRGAWPVVTVQLPLYNEATVAERLIDACAQLDYPRRRLEIQVLDDSADETTALVARRVEYWQRRGLDIAHLRRTDRTGYKAGALQNGLRLARGTLIAIFDADFVPPPDFLRRTVPAIEEAPAEGERAVGMVQARWGHLNAADSLLTRVQAFGLDAHFAIEQQTRARAGCFMNFNGTAGLWRRACIEDAGGWQHDTLTEDLDLSYRAQLRGWVFRYLPRVEVPAELPVEMEALRAQQFRWTKGAVETARKMLRPLWRSGEPHRVKWQGTLHLTAHLVFPFILLAAAVHAPLLVLKNLGQGPGALYFALMGFGMIGFAGFFLVQLFAQRALYPDWRRRLRLFPAFMAGTIGLALSNTRAVWQALRGRQTAFVRTPKHNRTTAEGASGENVAAKGGAWWRSRYAGRTLAPVVWGEVLLALYCGAGLGATLFYGEWAAVPFQALFTAGFAMVAAASLRQTWRVRRSPSGGND